jgi:hypothetical protein
MGKTQAILIGAVSLVVFIAIIVGLYLLGGSDQSALERLRDITIVLIGLISLIMVILMLVVVAVLVWLVMTIKDKIVPLLETLVETAQRVKGTTDFITEEVASPVINVYGNVARARAMVKTVTGRDRSSERSTISKILKK